MKDGSRANLRIYIGAAPGVGKNLRDDREMRIASVARASTSSSDSFEAHGRADTQAAIGDLEVMPRQDVWYRGVAIEELDLDAILRRKPRLCVIDELAHSNGRRQPERKTLSGCAGAFGRRHRRNDGRQHPASRYLNDAVSRVTGVRVRETVPDTFLDRADESGQCRRDG
jgi:two-component system sensor histidine kinase KdpD